MLKKNLLTYNLIVIWVIVGLFAITFVSADEPIQDGGIVEPTLNPIQWIYNEVSQLWENLFNGDISLTDPNATIEVPKENLTIGKYVPSIENQEDYFLDKEYKKVGDILITSNKVNRVLWTPDGNPNNIANIEFTVENLTSGDSKSIISTIQVPKGYHSEFDINLANPQLIVFPDIHPIQTYKASESFIEANHFYAYNSSTNLIIKEKEFSNYLPFNNPISVSEDFGDIVLDPTVSACGEISTTGIYTQNQDILVPPNQTCINITGSGVTYDGGGYRLINAWDVGTIAIAVNNDTNTRRIVGVNISNVAIINSTWGIILHNTTSNGIYNVSINTTGICAGTGQPCGAGISIQGNPFNTYNTTIENVTILTNASNGISGLFGGMNFTVIRDSYIFYNGSGTGSSAITIPAGSRNILIFNNTILANISKTLQFDGNNISIINNFIVGGQAANTQNVVSATGGTDTVNITGNRIATYHLFNSINNVIQLTTPTNTFIVNNTLLSNAARAVLISVPDNTNWHRLVIENNTLLRNVSTNSGIAIGTINIGGRQAGNITIKNNYIWTNDSGMGGIFITQNVTNLEIYNNTIDTLAANSTGILLGFNRGTTELIGAVTTKRQNISITNNTITTRGRESRGIIIDGFNTTTIQNNLIMTNGTNATGIEFKFTNMSMIFNNTIITRNQSAHGIYIHNNSNGNILGNNNIFTNWTTQVQSFAIYDDNIGEINGATGVTNNTLIYNNTFGQILWTNESFKANLSVFGGLSWYGGAGSISSANITLGNNTAFVNMSAFNTTVSFMNSSANISFYGISTAYTNASIFKNAVFCGTDCFNFTNLNGGNPIFNVSTWANEANYSIQAGGGGTPPANTCTYTSGNYAVNCSDNCVFTTNVVSSGANNNLSIIGNGTFSLINANITGFRYKYISGNALGICRGYTFNGRII